MVSRRKILSRSRDNLADAQYEQEEEEDVWYNMDKLYKVRQYWINNSRLYANQLVQLLLKSFFRVHTISSTNLYYPRIL